MAAPCTLVDACSSDKRHHLQFFSKHLPDAETGSRVRERLSLLVLPLCIAAVGAVGATQLAKDGSLWRDEASVAISLLELSPLELFGRLEGGQSFPRVVLLAIYGMKALFGYETLVLRALPFLFFALGTVGWMWLLFRRLRTEPLLLVAAGLLTIISGQWFIQAAMLKPYTFDVFAALIPFLLSESFYESTLGRGERRWRLFALTALGALSYPFAVVLLGRLAGWWVGRWTTQGIAVDRGAAATGTSGLLIFLGLVWLTDLRHTADLSVQLRNFWSGCVLGDPRTNAWTALNHLSFAWYDGGTTFARKGGLPSNLLLVVKLGFAAGILRLGASLLRPRSSRAASPPEWGSRSLGYAAVLCGLVLASVLFDYPICAGRLTLFVLLPLQIVTLEGFCWASLMLSRLPKGGWFAAAASFALVVAIAPTAHRDATRLMKASAPDDLRPALALIRERPDLPLVATSCTRKQIETLPERAALDTHFTGPPRAPQNGLREAAASPEAWILFVPEDRCKNEIRSLVIASSEWTPKYGRPYSGRLVLAKFPDAPPPKK